MEYKPTDRCRVCGSHNLAFLFSIGEQYVNDFPLPGEERDGLKVPIELELCRDCTLVQARYTAPSEILYRRFYWYRSGVTATMRGALRDITRAVESLASLRPGDVVLDIGSNDGTLLRSYATPGIVRVGVEPAENLAEEGARGLDQLIRDFWSVKHYQHDPARVVTAIGMFYDMDDPNQFVADIAAVLAPNGLFVAQLMCLRDMVELGDVGNLAHEHLEYYSLRSLEYLFGRHGMEIIDLERNKVNGGSYRLYCRKIGGTVRPKPGAAARISEAKQAEEALADERFYRHVFFPRLEQNKRAVVGCVHGAVELGKRIWVYGASTKGNVILQYYGLGRQYIEGAAERSPEKWGRVMVGTGIPIYSEQAARKANPDYFLVLPYAFLSEFIAREAAWRSRGGRFIVPLPEFRVV